MIVAAVGNGRRGGCQLQGCGLEGALTDADDDRLPGKPHLLVAPAFPFPGRAYALALADQIDARLFAEAELLQVLLQLVDADFMGKLVEEHVAGLGDGGVHVHGAMPPLLPVAVLVIVAGKLEITGTVFLFLEIQKAQLQAGQAHEGLDGGAGRIGSLHGAVVQGFVWIVPQGLVGLRADAFNEGIGVVAWFAGQSQHAAVPGIDGHHGAVHVAQGVQSHLLQGCIHMQAQAAARAWRCFLEHAHGLAQGIDFHFLHAHLAVQGVFVGAFHPGLADVGGAGVVGSVDGFQVFQADAAHVAHHVGHDLLHGVGARQTGLDGNAGKLVAIDREQGGFFLGDVQLDGDALEVAFLPPQPVKALPVLFTDAQEHVQVIQCLVDVGHQLGNDLQVEGRAVQGQGAVLAVVDQSPRRRQGNQLDPVVLGQGGEMLVIYDLQVDHAPHDAAKQDDHEQAGNDGPAGEQAAFLLVVLEFQVS